MGDKPTALRYDGNKLNIGLIPVPALLELAMVFTKGAIKYLPENWRLGMLWSRVYTPTERHLTKWKLGQKRDPENGCHHLLQCAWGCFVLYMYERWADRLIGPHMENDDRTDKLSGEEIEQLFKVELTEAEEEFIAKKNLPGPVDPMFEIPCVEFTMDLECKADQDRVDEIRSKG